MNMPNYIEGQLVAIAVKIGAAHHGVIGKVVHIIPHGKVRTASPVYIIDISEDETPRLELREQPFVWPTLVAYRDEMRRRAMTYAAGTRGRF